MVQKLILLKLVTTVDTININQESMDNDFNLTMTLNRQLYFLDRIVMNVIIRYSYNENPTKELGIIDIQKVINNHFFRLNIAKSY